MRRLLMLSAAIMIPVVGAGLGFAGVAAASTSGPTSVSCAKLKGTLTGNNAKLKNCSDPRATGGQGTVPIAALESGSGTITWNGTGTTTVDNVTDTPTMTNTCASGDEEFQVSGDVTGGTGHAVKAMPSGWTFSGDVCLDPSTLKLSLAPSSQLVFTG